MTTPEHSQEEPAAARPLTASATLRLATPAALSEGLRLLGLLWQPAPWETEPGDAGPGMYAWVIPGDADDLLHCPALYLGIGEGARGWRGRVRKEESWRTGDHAHGVAIRRAKAKAVGGPVDRIEPDLSWLPGIVSDKGVPIIEAYLGETVAAAPLKAAEAIVVRMAFHLGDVGAPVNSTHGGAWNNDSGQDWAGFAAARKLRKLRGEEDH
ncbi:hypothetical protein [Actinoplanes sp. HUAS TT8]|uniref:hypothetical protein n=1 Tax=Actinoplanes sp. HUAS TT8 TaxID=3447453 RepID=UPI003F5234D2